MGQKLLKREFAILQGHAAPEDAGASSADEGEPKRKKLKVRLGGPKPPAITTTKDEEDDAEDEDDRKPTTTAGHPTLSGTTMTSSAKIEKEGSAQPSTNRDNRSDPGIGSAPTGGPPTVKAYLRTRLQALEEVKENDRPNGRRLIAVFEDLPDRIEWKQYYEIILNPMSFGVIRVSLLSSSQSDGVCRLNRKGWHR